MELTPLYQRVIGLDVHQAKITACALIEHEDGRLEVILREFGAFKRDRKALSEWAREIAPEMVVMESTGVYWKSPYAALEKVGIVAWVVNARHVKTVPGRKTDIADAQWLATLARAMIKALIEGRPLHKVLDRKGRLRASREELFEALNTEQFSQTHRFVAAGILDHIEQLEQHIARLDQYLLDALKEYEPLLALLETIPGIDRQGAAMLLVEIGADINAFGSAERLASWVGICPDNHESADKRKSGRIRRGNPWVRRLLCEFAQAAARTRCGLKAKFESLMIRKGVLPVIAYL